ncbi:class I SAM-dependent methyltransferase [Oceanidesulfovibrio marinus]|uniref:SAM-dependent methyltransferase n=1 Tax=Oceanidesulfovibrio marinus TaxID=370038 RepID=A0A6P1ZKL2_9BACT|nr:class I SAM-dependent methyltransferase [Oceanidesulfovibrio marinus]QJT07631.1 class I SAM-dependent methyltransferase [Oceanidesulfovibrio marinus]TVM34455.1 SAM-dependent methyltransferase [Oceanidesulfovibrio marinus]
MSYIDFLTPLHTSTKRDYLKRMMEYPKAETITVAKRYDHEYWDGDRRFGYGGYKYDGRWRVVAEAMAEQYNLKPGQKVLDVGCGKAFLLYELTQVVPGLEVAGMDISSYAIENAKEEVRPMLQVADATKLPYEDNSFDFVISLNVLHNLYCQDLDKALREIERVGKKNKYIVVESYRNEQEKVNLMCWVLTGECFFTPEEWEWWFQQTGYTGDHSFIYFE